MTDVEENTKLVLIESENELLEERKDHFFQVDFLKAVMIFLVIFDHMVSWNVKSEIGVIFWERISIPVFLVIMGFNMGLSFQKKNTTKLSELYSWSYFKSKIIRYIIPFLVLYAVSTFIGLFMYGFDLSAMYYGQYYPEHGVILLFIGFLPFWGPGNWFLPLLFQSIIVLPLLYKAFTKNPILSLILCFAIEIFLQLFIFFFFGEITTWEESYIVTIFMTSVLFYLPGIGLGMWLSFGFSISEERNLLMGLLFLISLVICIYHQFFSFRFRSNDGILLLRGDYHFLIVPYSAFLVLLALNFLPQKSESKISQAISMIGKSTYHILLIQILGYGMIFAFWGTHYGINVGFGPDKILDMIFAWLLFVSLGTLWYKIDKNRDLLRRILYTINLFIIFTSLLFLTFWGQAYWIPIPLLIILIYAGIALIINYIIKNPVKIRSLILWTGFLFMNFAMMILQISILQPSEAWITFIPITMLLIFTIVGTILDYYYT